MVVRLFRVIGAEPDGLAAGPAEVGLLALAAEFFGSTGLVFLTGTLRDEDRVSVVCSGPEGDGVLDEILLEDVAGVKRLNNEDPALDPNPNEETLAIGRPELSS